MTSLPRTALPYHFSYKRTGLPVPQLNLIIIGDCEQWCCWTECCKSNDACHIPFGYLFTSIDIPDVYGSYLWINRGVQDCQMFSSWADNNVADMCFFIYALAEFVDNFICVWVNNLNVCWHDAQKGFITKKDVLFWEGLSNRANRFKRKRCMRKAENADDCDMNDVLLHDKPPNISAIGINPIPG